MCQFSAKQSNFEFFGLNLPKNGFRFWYSENYCWNKNQKPRDNTCTNFQVKQTALTFLAPKNGFRVRNSENLCWNKKWHRQDVMHANFQEKRTTNLLYYEYCTDKQKYLYVYLSPDSESALPRYQFSVKINNFDFFGQKFAQKGN